MPATDHYWRDLPQMHRLFAWSAVALLVATVLMMWKDQSREYIGYQMQAEQLRLDKLAAEQEAVQSGDYVQELASLNEQKKAAEGELKGSGERVAELNRQLQGQRGRSEILQVETKSFNAQRDKARADYDITIRDNAPAEKKAEKKAIFDDYLEKAMASAVELEKVQQEIKDTQSELDAVNAAVTDLTTQITKFENKNKQIQDQIDNLRPETFLASIKRSIKTIPIIEGFNPIYRIQYDWAQEIKEQIGSTSVTRLDRCRSCHVNISEFGAGNVASYPEGEYEQPFCSHPDPDLYLTATSPHPRDKFACTICHGGDGSGTSFQNAEHTPNDPAIAHEWEQEKGWHSNHFWEHPMEPSRFVQSACLRCHHQVVELAESAPKVVEGHRLITQLGCFGCHEMNGFDGTKPIGPDLRLEPQTPEEAAKIAADPNAIAGKMRKVGPSLRHIAAKTTSEFVANWTWDPVAFRPTTRMPKFFGLENQHDHLAEKLQPMELAGIAAYLSAKSQSIDLLQPEEGYVPDVERGKIAFERRGCMACHSHGDPDFAGIKQDFGPELSRVHEKIKPGPEGFNWLYTWVKEPTRHHARTKMPDLKLFPEGEGDTYVDPAADITAFLLQGGPAQFPEIATPKAYIGVAIDPDFTAEEAAALGMDGKSYSGVRVTQVLSGSPAERASTGSLQVDDVITKFNEAGVKSADHLAELEAATPVGTEVTLTIVRNGQTSQATLKVSTPLDDLTRYFLRKSVSQARLDEILASRRFLVDPAVYDSEGGVASVVKGDEIELVATSATEEVSDEVWNERKLQYVGRRTISRYGCYACHDIPGYEAARPIGAGLNDWGRKETSKLAFEHIVEFLHHHGEPDGSSTMERAEKALTGKLKDLEVSDADLSAAFYVESIEHHGRPGFIWQKLREPRSYDYSKTETKGWDERLRMPKFNLTEDQIEAVATFVLGLVADPPTPAYQFRPQGPKSDIIEGTRLLAKYNCTGCHMLTPPSVDVAVAPEDLPNWEIADIDRPAVERMWKLRPILDARTDQVGPEGKPVFHINAHVQQFQEGDVDFGEPNAYSFLTWDSHKISDDILVGPGKTIAAVENQIIKRYDPVGGAWTSWLIPRLVESAAPGVKDLNTAWQATAPNLYKEGTKVQTPWLYQFLKNPEQLRYTTVLRMPRFNMDDAEAKVLANYFAAVDGVEYPYQKIAPKEPEIQTFKSTIFSAKYPSSEVDYLTASWRTLNLTGKCANCHAVGGNVVTGADPSKTTKAPNLNRVESRLRPDWVDVWIYEPHWITPYTAMPVNFASDQTGTKDLFDGDNVRQSEAAVDALFNYTRLLEIHGQTLYTPSDAPAAPPAGGN